MKKITKILLIPLIIVVAFTSLMGIASATYIPVITPAYFAYVPVVPSAIHEAVTGGEKAALVVSSAMAPTIQEGAIVYYRSVLYEQLSVGDIIIAKPGFNDGHTSMILRRIVTINSEGLTTKGDGNPSQDYWTTTPDMVIGRVTGINNPNGNSNNYNSNDQGGAINNNNQPPSNITANYGGGGEFQILAQLNGNQYSGNITANVGVSVQQVGSSIQFSLTITPTSVSGNIAPLTSTDGTNSTFNFAGTVSGSQVIANANGTSNGESFDINLSGTIDSNTFAFTVTSGSDAQLNISTAQQIVTRNNA